MCAAAPIASTPASSHPGDGSIGTSASVARLDDGARRAASSAANPASSKTSWISAAHSPPPGANPTRRYRSEFWRTPSAQFPRAFRSGPRCCDGVAPTSGDSGTTSLSCDSGTALIDWSRPGPSLEGVVPTEAFEATEASAASFSFCIWTLRSNTAMRAAASAAMTSTACVNASAAPSLGGTYPGYGPAFVAPSLAALPFFFFCVPSTSASSTSVSSGSSRRAPRDLATFSSSSSKPLFDAFRSLISAPRQSSSSISGLPPTHLTSARNRRQSAPLPRAVRSFPISCFASLSRVRSACCPARLSESSGVHVASHVSTYGMGSPFTDAVLEAMESTMPMRAVGCVRWIARKTSMAARTKRLSSAAAPRPGGCRECASGSAGASSSSSSFMSSRGRTRMDRRRS